MLDLLRDHGIALCISDHHDAPSPWSDIDTAVVDSLKVLDPNRPIREADIIVPRPDVRI